MREVDDPERGFAHGRTLLGAIDTFLGRLAHTRPWLMDAREPELEAMAEAWLADGGANWLPSLAPEWIDGHLAGLPADAAAARAESVADLLGWAREEGLLPAS